MKLKTLCAAALVTVIGASLVPVGAYAQTDLDSKGTVEVGAGIIDPTDPDSIVDPEDPDGPGIDPNTPGVTPNPDIKDKGIIAVSDLDFGTIAIGKTTANAKAIELIGGKAGETRGNIVSFGDVTGEYTGYTISAELTSQFSNGTAALDGSTITYTNPLLATSGTGSITAAPSASVTLSTENGPQNFVKAANGEGSGLWTLEFGQSAAYTGAAGTDSESVTLEIPTSVASSMAKATYVATVTWTMGATA
ncbi:WxL domain-containing protein [Enterococcus sp. BWM-S5]|uniref:WxL domain-containing protein n=1 Tax=Enterococcus larvae TaxID=2794352 RepID=A0ABS4CN28_9ENTE|nr:WxL domain-containing protein [Enterococcus larvae]MBP1047987.1 WxL domain-containing protein [Enterococcus larvae]